MVQRVQPEPDGAREIQVLTWVDPRSVGDHVARFGSMRFEEAAPGETLADDAVASEPEEPMKIDFSGPPATPAPQPAKPVTASAGNVKRTPPRPKVSKPQPQPKVEGSSDGEEENLF